MIQREHILKLKYIQGTDCLIAYNANTMQTFRFRGEAQKVIPSLLPENYTEQQKEKYLREVAKVTDENFKGLLLDLVQDPELNFGEGREVITVSFAPVHQCNMQCKYCFADGGENYQGSNKEMSEETLYKIFEFIFKEYAPDCKFILVSLVSGGEPFLNLDICTKINEAIDHYKKDVKRKIFIGTNLTLYNEEIGKKLQDINPQLGVSIDGNEKMHNQNRVFVDGEGTYSVVVNNLDKLKKDSNLSSKTQNCIFMTVITEDNLDLVEILKHHKELGATSVQMRVARSKENSTQGINEENLNLFIKAYEELNDFFLAEFKENRTDYLNMILNSTDYFGKYIKRIMLQDMCDYRCGAGKDKLSFTAEGDIYPCDSFLGKTEFCLGNVYQDKEISNRFYAYSIRNNTTCSNCWAKLICTGDCLFNSYARTGKVDKPDEIMCKFYRKLAEMAIQLINNMMSYDINRYKTMWRKLQVRENNNNIS